MSLTLYSANDFERYEENETHSSTRSEFERDRARILHSSTLRRLGAKTQVLGAGYDDFVRTRLTHSLEVSQVGRDLANMLKCDTNIVECACLSHDLGHPPFGHKGEAVLNELAKDIGGFEGNAQTLRILTRLEPKIYHNALSFGLNLTRASLDASIKYPWLQSNSKFHPTADRSTKFGVYPDDADVFEWIRKYVPHDKKFDKCVEAQIMDLSDDISYCVHDIEDAIVSSSVKIKEIFTKESQRLIYDYAKAWYSFDGGEERLREAIMRLKEAKCLPVNFDGSRQSYAQLKNMTSSLIGRFCNQVIFDTKEVFGNEPLYRYNGNLIVSDSVKDEILALKSFCAAFVMAPLESSSQHHQQIDVIYRLYEKFQNPQNLLPEFRFDYENSKCDNDAKRVIIDQIASLTDNSAKRLANDLV